MDEIIDKLGIAFTEDPTVMDDLLADDVVIEVPFAMGGAKTWHGKDEWLAYAVPSRAQLPVSFDEFKKVAVHRTDDPEVAVVEYELGGVITTTGRHHSARFIGVLRVRDGQIAGWREYQNTMGIVAALTEQ